jgi:hypothetical protein
MLEERIIEELAGELVKAENERIPIQPITR